MIPTDRKYSKEHEWILVEGEAAKIGITDFAQDALGELVHVDLPEVGDEVSAGDSICEVESVKAVAEVYSPVSGEVVGVNEELEDAAEQINEDPYGAWLFQIRMSEAPSGLLDAGAYEAKIAD